MVSGNPVSIGGLVSMVSDELARLGDNPNLLTVVLRADQRGMSRTVNEVVTALGRLQITRIRIAVEVPQ